MSNTHSTTHNVSGLSDCIAGTHTYRTDISDGDSKVSGYGATPREAQENASEKWEDDD